MKPISNPTRAAALAILLLAAGCDSGAEDVRASPAPADGTIQLTPEQVRSSGIEVQAVALESITLPVRVPGTLASPDTATMSLGSVVEGQVAGVMVVAGQQVLRGAPLLRIHSHELTAAMREREGARARLGYTRSALERSRTLLESGAVSREEVERRQAEHDDLQAEMTRSEEWVEHLNPSPEGYVVVRAPREGVVFKVHVGPGSAVTPGTQLLEIGGTRVLWATGFVPENTAANLAPGAEIGVELPALGNQSVRAKIVSMGGMVDAQRRAVEVRGELERVPLGARPGMFATLTLAAGDPAPRTVLPADAVQRTLEGEVVYVEVEPGRYRAQPVTAVPVGDARVAVDGIAEGTRVVVRGGYVLRSVAEGAEEAE